MCENNRSKSRFLSTGLIRLSVMLMTVLFTACNIGGKKSK